jgi:hypothetical protein
MLRLSARKSYLFTRAATGVLVLLGAAWFLLSRPARFGPKASLPANRPPAGAVSPTVGQPGATATGREAEAQAAGAHFAEQLFWRGALFSELNPQTWAESYPAVYRDVQADREYAARFVEAAGRRENSLVKATLGDPPLVVDEANRAVLSAQVSGPVGRAIRQGLREPGSYRHDAADQSRPRPCYHRGRWCWKVDRFWYRSRNTFGLDVKDCVAAVVAKDDPYHEYKVVTLEEAAF